MVFTSGIETGGGVGQVENARPISKAPLLPRGSVQRGSAGSTGPPLETSLPLFPALDLTHSSAGPQHPVLWARSTPLIPVTLAPNAALES